MADAKISALTNLTAADPTNDMIPIVDVSDTPPASGNTKRISINNILSSSPTASGALTVTGLVTAGSATITGDLTVDTNTLKVDSTNNRVGVNNATPSFPLDLTGTGSNTPFRLSGNLGTSIRFDTIRSFVSNRNWIVGCDEIAEGVFGIIPSTAIGGSTFTNPVYKVSYDGIHTFLDGAGGTRMTLNSTGLGVGTAPSVAKLELQSATDTLSLINSTNTAQGNRAALFMAARNLNGNVGNVSIEAISVNNQQNDLVFRTGSTTINGFGTERMRIDTSGNVGIGVTPSAKLDVVVPGAGSPRVRFNGDSDNPFIEFQRFQGTASNFFGSRVQGMFGGMAFWVSNSAAIGSQTFTQAMTLDASGNLILLSSATPATLATNGQLTVNATSNTNLRFSYRGSDGTTRVANITLA